MELQELKDLYEQYKKEYAAVRKKASFFDGLFGMGNDPKKDPCHMRFYENAESWVKAFAAGDPSEEEAYAVTQLLLTAAQDHRKQPEEWIMVAAQRLSLELIDLLSPDHCAQLESWYNKAYPRRIRLPIQNDIHKLLQKGARKK